MNPNTNEEISDAIAIRDTAAVLVECKGTFVTSSAKYSGVPGRFFRGLTQKFGRANHGGVFQLARAIEDIWAAPNVGNVVQGSSKVTDVYPVLILLDPIADCGPVARVLSDRMLVALKRMRWTTTKKHPKIWPLTVVTPNDLDRLAFAIDITKRPLPELLRRFHRHHQSRMFSFGDFLTSKDAEDFVPRDEVYEKINRRFKDSTEGTLQRFQGAEYHA
jgi:hypothetical protein